MRGGGYNDHDIIICTAHQPPRGIYFSHIFSKILTFKVKALLLNNSPVTDGLYVIYGLVAVVPGVQLLVSRMVVDAAVAGVTLGKKQDWTLLTAKTDLRWEGIHRCSGFISYIYIYLYYHFQPVDGVVDVIETLHRGAPSVACVVDHVECSTDQERSLGVTAWTLCVPGVLHCQTC